MTVLTFTLKQEPRQRVDMSPLTPDHLADTSPDLIGALLLQTGNRQVRAEELFAIAGDDPSLLVFKAATGKLDFIGRGMREGEIRVEGDAGSYLAMQLRGGRVTVTGNVDAYAACEMKNGIVLIGGNAGDFVGAALPGNKKGMAGGVVIVKGHAGDRVGDHLRRGSILIEGDAGAYLGSRMTAGTIAVLGRTGPHPGFGMGRGTLLLAQAPETLPATFNDCGTHTLGFIPLLLNSYAGLDTAFAGLGGKLARVRRYAGDMSALGKGEILVAL